MHVALPGHLIHGLLHVGLIGRAILVGWLLLRLLTRLWRRSVRAKAMEVHEIILHEDGTAHFLVSAPKGASRASRTILGQKYTSIRFRPRRDALRRYAWA